MIEVSIIVQLREVTHDGRKGRCAIGVRQFRTHTATPQKSWRVYFEDASRRALTKRHQLIEGNHLAAPIPKQLTLTNQKPLIFIDGKPPDRAADPRGRRSPKFTGQVAEE